MNTRLRVCCVFAFIVCCLPVLHAQFPFHYWSQSFSTSFRISINPASIIRVVPSSVQLALTPLVAGGPVVNDVDNSSYMLVTSIAENSSANKKIQVQITNGSVPTGTTLKLAAALCTTGSGNFGRVFSLTLNNNAQTLVDKFSSCYTGNGPNDGYNLTYRWELNTGTNLNLIPISSTAVVVTYTISQW